MSATVSGAPRGEDMSCGQFECLGNNAAGELSGGAMRAGESRSAWREGPARGGRCRLIAFEASGVGALDRATFGLGARK